MMKRLFNVVFAAAIFVSSSGYAASLFDGTWKRDLATAEMTSIKPYEMLLVDDVFHCDTGCKPPYKLKADGEFHPVPLIGDDAYDEESIKVIDAQSVLFTDRLAGKIVSVTKYAVSADDKSYRYESTDISRANGKQIVSSGIVTRLKSGPAGSHAISGTWHDNGPDTLSPESMTFTYKLDGKKVHYVRGTGESFDAVVGGPKVVMRGDELKTMKAVRMPSKTAMVVSGYRKGKLVDIFTLNVASDGESMNVVYESKENNFVYKYKARKQ
jgi:hypothetical protein